jgi:hypothetical protein
VTDYITTDQFPVNQELMNFKVEITIQEMLGESILLKLNVHSGPEGRILNTLVPVD